MSDEGRGRRKEPWEMTGPELIEALATSVFSGATMTTAQAREVQALIFCPWCEVRGFNGCVEHALDCPRQAALSAPGQPEGTSEPSDFDALLEHHKATEAENALFKRALEYIVRRGYHGASFVADKALAGIDVTAALFAPGQPEGER